MVGEVMAEDEVLGGPGESLVNLGFEPGGRRVDGVGGDRPSGVTRKTEKWKLLRKLQRSPAMWVMARSAWA